MEITINLTLKLDGNEAKVVDKVIELGSNVQQIDESQDEDVFAAIAMALYELRNESSHHDWEETVLTIEKVKKDYSPWSSKIYGLREIPVLRKR